MTPMRNLLAVLLAIALAACGGARPRAKTAASQPGYAQPAADHSVTASLTMKAEELDSVAAGSPTPEPPPPPPLPASVPPPPAAPEPAAMPAAPEPTAALPKSIQTPTPNPPVANDGIESGQMLIYTANLTMAVYRVEHGLAAVEKIAHDLGGYLATRTDLAITIRVPRAEFEKALRMIEPSGDVLHREIKAEDVTDEYFDLEVRLHNARAMRDRLAKLLGQAAVKEALDIEKELARVTEEIERIEGKLKLFRHRVAYSTINVMFQARGTAVQTRPLRLPFSWLDQLGLPNLLQLEDK